MAAKEIEKAEKMVAKKTLNNENNLDKNKLETDSFNAFCKEQRPDIKSENPGMKLGEQQKLLKEIWDTLDDESKHEYSN